MQYEYEGKATQLVSHTNEEDAIQYDEYNDNDPNQQQEYLAIEDAALTPSRPPGTEGWERHVDEFTNEVFYFNSETSESKWEAEF